MRAEAAAANPEAGGDKPEKNTLLSPSSGLVVTNTLGFLGISSPRCLASSKYRSENRHARVPIGALGGLIGLGGGEFRLPVLMYGIGFDARTSVPMNLLTSLVTLAFGLAVRSRAISLDAVIPYVPAMIGLLAGGMVSAFYGTRLV